MIFVIKTLILLPNYTTDVTLKEFLLIHSEQWTPTTLACVYGGQTNC